MTVDTAPAPPQLAWARGEFKVRVQDWQGRRVTDRFTGYVAGPFGIHHYEFLVSSGWTVTHLNSGHSIGPDFPTLKAAKQFCTEIAPLAEWDQLTAKNAKRETGLREAVKAAAVRHGGYR